MNLIFPLISETLKVILIQSQLPAFSELSPLKANFWSSGVLNWLYKPLLYYTVQGLHLKTAN